MERTKLTDEWKRGLVQGGKLINDGKKGWGRRDGGWYTAEKPKTNNLFCVKVNSYDKTVKT